MLSALVNPMAEPDDTTDEEPTVEGELEDSSEDEEDDASEDEDRKGPKRSGEDDADGDASTAQG